jgi:2-polyprenyl-6-methoxyphenol hydroxylase-like FAD-dependent oxidoreductase
LALLRTAVPQGTVRLGAELQNMVEAQDRVAVALRDGTHEEGVLLVGADGVRSTVRSLVGVHQAPRAAVLSRSSWRFVTRNLGVGCRVVWSGGRDTVLFIPLGDERLYGWVSLGRDAASFADVVAACGDFPRLVRNVLDAAASEPIAPLLSPLEEVRPAAWTPGRVVLVGDAAHATAPVWAQGAALAIEDALVLGEILTGTEVWNDAGHEFERRRRARVEHVQTMTDRFSHAARLPTWLRDRIVRVVGPRSYRATYEPLRDSVTSH